MGVVRVTVKLTNPDNVVEPVEVGDAVVDTGSMHTVLPRKLATNLGLKKTGTLEVLTASGPDTLDITYAFIELQGKGMMLPMLVSNVIPSVIVGVTLLEMLGFIVDPVREELRETDVLLL